MLTDLPFRLGQVFFSAHFVSVGFVYGLWFNISISEFESESRSKCAHVSVCNSFCAFFFVEKCSSHIIIKSIFRRDTATKTQFLLIWSWVHWDEHVSSSGYRSLPSKSLALRLAFLSMKNIEEVIVTDEELLSNKLNDTRHTQQQNGYDLFWFYVILRWHGLCKCCNRCHVLLMFREEPSTWLFPDGRFCDSTRWQFHLRRDPSSRLSFNRYGIFYEPRNRNEHNFIAVQKHEPMRTFYYFEILISFNKSPAKRSPGWWIWMKKLRQRYLATTLTMIMMRMIA